MERQIGHAGWANFDPQTTEYPTPSVTINAGDITTNTTWGESALSNMASFSSPNLNNTFFEQVNYVGAFGSNDWTEGWANLTAQNTNYPATTVTIEAGEITGDVTWRSNNVYLLNGFLYVRENATLTIKPGTVIRGDKTNKGTIIVERGGKLNAIGDC